MTKRCTHGCPIQADHEKSAISYLAGEQLENVKALLDSPIGRHRDVFLYALLIVMHRLGSPWQLIRLAIHAAASDLAEHIAATPFAVAVDVVVGDLDRIITDLRDAVQRADSDEAARLVKDFHDAARALHTEIELPPDSDWGRRLATARAEVADLLEGEIDNLAGQVRRLLRPRNGRDATAPLDSIDVDDLEAKLALVAACRNYAGELAVSEVTLRVYSELQSWFDNNTDILLERLRAAPPAERALRQSQLDAAIRFCAKLFGAEYAGTLARAADVAGKDEPKAAKG